MEHIELVSQNANSLRAIARPPIQSARFPNSALIRAHEEPEAPTIRCNFEATAKRGVKTWAGFSMDRHFPVELVRAIMTGETHSGPARDAVRRHVLRDLAGHAASLRQLPERLERFADRVATVAIAGTRMARPDNA